MLFSLRYITVIILLMMKLNFGDDNAHSAMNTLKSLESFDSDLESIYTSTPKKTIQCEECLDTSEYVDCFVKHMLGKHGIARAIIF